MVTKRQREARRRFKEANPDLFTQAPQQTEPAAISTAKKAKKRKSLLRLKRKSMKPASKHPLRVPGMRPGENCFICKSPGHAAKNCPEKSQWDRKKICLLCRERGHTMKQCPNRTDGGDKLCYNCGEKWHSLSKCPKPIKEGGSQFASCFICNAKGHLSKDCPENKNGIYPKGGCCKICGGVTHLAKNCPNKREGNIPTSSDLENNDAGLEEHQETWHVRFGGDDLEDDFVGALAPGQGDCAKSSKRQGPKLVNFLV